MPPVKPYVIPAWADPQNASVLDDWWTRAKRTIGSFMGMTDPASQIMGLAAAPIDVPAADAAKVTMRAFHGSPNQFTVFDLAKAGSTTDKGELGRAVYLSTDPAVAAPSTYQYAADVSLSNPLRVQMTKWDANKSAIVKQALGLPSSATADDITKAAMAKGHDGVVLDYSPLGYKHQELAVYQPESSISRLAQQSPTPLKAYHGSPHDFERFDSSKIGTGEGAQAQGHGLYFAEKPAVAETYRDKLGGGKVYEVDIKAHPDDFLDWDKPLNQQSESVQKALGPSIEYLKSRPLNPQALQKLTDGSAKGRELYLWLSGEKTLDAARLTWPNVPKRPNAVGAKYLTEQGIPGIQYHDAGSRTALGRFSSQSTTAPEDLTRNFVIFPGNEHLIDIARKYGVSLAAAKAIYEARQRTTPQPAQSGVE